MMKEIPSMEKDLQLVTNESLEYIVGGMKLFYNNEKSIYDFYPENSEEFKIFMSLKSDIILLESSDLKPQQVAYLIMNLLEQAGVIVTLEKV